LHRAAGFYGRTTLHARCGSIDSARVGAAWRWSSQNVADDELDAIHSEVFAPLPLTLSAAALPTNDIAAYVFRSVERIRRLGWHVQFYTPGR